MRVVAVGLGVGLGLVLAAVGTDLSRVVHAERVGETNGQRFAAGDLIALTSQPDELRQQVVLVDAKARVMSVYHIDRKSGEITLKSVRAVHWDLLMEEFNGTSPAPRDIRSLLQQSR